MSHYKKLAERVTVLDGQLERYNTIKKNVYAEQRRYLSGGGSTFMCVPASLHDEFDALLDRCREHYLAEKVEAAKRMDAVDTLLAGFDAKQGGAA